MSNKTFPGIDKKFGEFVRVWAINTTPEEIQKAKMLNFDNWGRADVSCGAFNVTNLELVESVAAALLEAVAFARAVNNERGVE